MLKLLVNQAFVPPRIKLEGLVLLTVIVQLEDIAILLEIRPVLPSLPLVVLVLLFNQSLWLLLNVDLELIASIRNALFYIPSPQAKTLLFPQPLLNPLLLHFVKQELLITLEVLLLGSVLPVLKTRIRPPSFLELLLLLLAQLLLPKLMEPLLLQLALQSAVTIKMETHTALGNSEIPQLTLSCPL